VRRSLAELLVALAAERDWPNLIMGLAGAATAYRGLLFGDAASALAGFHLEVRSLEQALRQDRP
jgi:hypothetical protein